MYEITAVTRENGSRRDPYPPTTVSLLTNPRVDFKSARTTRISHLRWLDTTDRPEHCATNQAGVGGPRGERGENAWVLSRPSKEPWSTPRGSSAGIGRPSLARHTAGASFWIAASSSGIL